MPLTDAQIGAQNPWWTTPGWEAADPHLKLLAAQPRRLPADLSESISLTAPGLHTVRGPRQVGKSTDLKLIAKRALEADRSERQVVYLAFDLLEGRPPGEMSDSIVRAKQLARPAGPCVLLLDEVTFVPRWRSAVKYLWDQGELREDVVVCTGSSAVDLRAGAERLPGRRGAGVDHGVWPQTFAAFAAALDPRLPATPRLTIAELTGAKGREACLGAQVHLPNLSSVLERYLRFGGLPAAVAEAIVGEPGPSEATRRIVYDSLLRELSRRGAAAPAAHALLERVIRSLGSKLSWSSLGRDLATSHTTAREYAEHMARAYFLIPTYFWRADSGSGELSKDKKLYFADPLLHAVALEHAPGLSDDIPAMIENAAAIALLHRYEPERSLVEGFEAIERLHVWGTRSGGELDFVCGAKDAIEIAEVKYRSTIDGRSISGAARAMAGRPFLVMTRDTLEFRDDHARIPAALALWALG